MKYKIKIRTSEITFDHSLDKNDFNNYYDSIEDIENDFNIEFSCGDGLFYSDIVERLFNIEYYTPSDELFDCKIKEEQILLEKQIEFYDGKVDFNLIRYKGKEYINPFLSFVYNDSEIIYLEHDRYSNFRVEIK